MLNWDDLRVFLAVRRHASHAGAARALAIDPTTIGRRVAALEAALETRVFRRTRAGLALTDAGTRLAEHAERVELEILASERALAGADVGIEGAVRVTAGDGIIAHVLVPAASELLARHPGLRLDLRADVRVLDLSRREADIALRLARPKQAAEVGRRLGVARYGLFASEAYLARRGRPSKEEQLADHDLLGYDATMDAAPAATWLRRRAGGELRIRSTTSVALAAAGTAGLGIALLLTAIARAHPALVQVLPRAEIPTPELWGVVHADARRNPRIVTVLDWAASAVAAAGMRAPPR